MCVPSVRRSTLIRPASGLNDRCGQSQWQAWNCALLGVAASLLVPALAWGQSVSVGAGVAAMGVARRAGGAQLSASYDARLQSRHAGGSACKRRTIGTLVPHLHAFESQSQSSHCRLAR